MPEYTVEGEKVDSESHVRIVPFAVGMLIGRRCDRSHESSAAAGASRRPIAEIPNRSLRPDN
jgi:hypothetical protein